jgi:hypothetical protein
MLETIIKFAVRSDGEEAIKIVIFITPHPLTPLLTLVGEKRESLAANLIDEQFMCVAISLDCGRLNEFLA